MKRMLICWLLGLLSWGLMAQDTLFVSTTQVVHLRFASELKYVNLGSRELVARIVDGSKDFVAVKAREAFDGVTSLSCLEVSGEMHTFLVAYSERGEEAGGGYAGIGRHSRLDREFLLFSAGHNLFFPFFI